MISKPQSATISAARLLAILEADGDWLDRKTLALRYDRRTVLAPHLISALQRLTDWGLVEVDARIEPNGRPHYFYRYIPRQ